MKTRKLCGADVAQIGLGCMNLSHAYGIPPDQESARVVLHAALDLGVQHFDTAALYGFGRNEALVGETLRPFRSRISLASKCGMTGVDGKRVIDGRPETLKQTCEESLRRLRTDVIDL
jgi:aryl-alcohol dehydrogenase-like predicted oxidoreductase